jgi:hypothetical protein
MQLTEDRSQMTDGRKTGKGNLGFYDMARYKGQGVRIENSVF